MKKFFVLAAGAALSLSLFVGSDKASAVESEFSGLDLKIESFKEDALQLLKKDYPDTEFLDLTIEEFEQQQKGLESNIVPFASAPPLSSLIVYAVDSTDGGYEYVSTKSSTVQDHGGDNMLVVTKEMGYGQVSNTTLDGTKLKELKRVFIDTNKDTIVDGWYIWWDASGYDGGTFTYQKTSSNYPWNSLTDSILIR